MYEQALIAIETSLFLDCILSTIPAVKPSFMTPSTCVLASSYYTKLKFQNYFLFPQLNDKHFEFNSTPFITISSYLAQCSISPFTRCTERRDMSIDNVIGLAAHGTWVHPLEPVTILSWSSIIPFICIIMPLHLLFFYVGASARVQGSEKTYSCRGNCMNIYLSDHGFSPPYMLNCY